MNTFTLKKALSGIALASAFVLAGCQKEDMMEEQMTQTFATTNTQHGKAIPEQYIVVFKNGNSNLGGNKVNALTMAGRAASAKLRERLVEAAAIERSAIAHTYEGAVNGFAARLNPRQLELLRQNPEVAYVEQDRILSLAKPTTSGGNTKETGNTKSGNTAKADDDTVKGASKGNGKNTKEPTPTEPAPTEPTPTEPTPTEPAPSEPETGSYTKITPLPGETLPWHVSMTGFGDGTGKTVWVIDSGIDTDHPDLNIDLARSASMIYGENSVEDGFGHGTAVAGLIAAKNNGSGMIGVAANATVVALRVFDNEGNGTMSRAISALNYVINYANAGDVVNLSLGGGISSTMDNAVVTAASKGIHVVIAAGNSAVDCSYSSPARVDAPGVYTISAMDRYQHFWSSSNFGAPVDFTAPGVGVTVTAIGGGIKSGGAGTSYAAPHVAGILLLRGKVFTQGTVIGDKDSWPDPIASLD